jgi:hypothetical protein
MSKDPNDLEPSAFDLWWAEVKEWRGKRQEKRQEERHEPGHWHRKNDAKRRKRSMFKPCGDAAQRHLRSFSIFGGILSIFTVIGGMLLVLLELLFGLFGVLIRFVLWAGVIIFVIWLLSDINLTVKTEDGIVKSEGIENVSSFLNQITDDIKAEYEKVSNKVHIKIRTTGEDGTEDVIEFGNKLTPTTPTTKEQ